MLKQKLSSNKFIITSEFFPPKGINVSKMLQKAKILKPFVDAVNITDCQRAVMRTSSLALSKMLLDHDIEPVYQITLRDRNSIALQSDILGAAVLGIENILVISGDYPDIGDHKNAIPVYELETVEFIKIIKGLENGFDMMGKKLNGTPSFCLGTALNPNATPFEMSLDAAVKKNLAGSSFFQTQPIFEIEKYLKLKNALTSDVSQKILVGVMLLKSYDFAKRIATIPGIYIPEEILERLKNAKDELNEGINIAVNLVKQLRSHAKGVHIMAIGIEEHIPRILEKSLEYRKYFIFSNFLY
ncbi:MAG: 5,10-methylenetetrahydrofolate reductase [bacterium]|nr:5,10-methylenetetrahydrofolate reductase [bacterium]